MKNHTINYYPNLDSLRGIAIILVILYHNFNFISFFNYGWLGVDVFFVLSGYLITSILLNSDKTNNFLRNFYVRRILRVFPLYYLVLFLFFVVFIKLDSFPLNLNFYVEHQWWFWLYLQNWVLIFHFDQSSTALNHFWSLAVEEQYYLLWPLVILAIRKPQMLLTTLLLILASIIIARVWIWNHRDHLPNIDMLFLFTRVDGIIIGSLLAILLAIKPAFLQHYTPGLILFLALLNFTFYFLNRLHQFNYPPWSIVGYTTFSALFALLVHEVVVRKKGKINYFLSFSPLRFFGKYSYGLYVFHWPVFLLLKPHTDAIISGYAIPNALQLILSSTLATLPAVLISIFSFHFFEKKFLFLKKRFL